MKTCKRCDETKKLSEFYKQFDGKDGTQAHCKICDNKRRYANRLKNIERDRKSSRDWQRKNNYSRKYKLKIKYGLELEDYNNLLEKQDFRCAICGTHQDEATKGILFVDHCHKTGKVRELLCSDCNFVLGILKEDTSKFVSCINYLEKHNGYL